MAAGRDVEPFFASDLDACLLDEASYSFEPARPALRELRARGVPLVLASSKTRAEMEPLARAIGCRGPLIVENGGALLIPPGFLPECPAGAREGHGWWTLPLGVPYEQLVEALTELSREADAPARGFSEMSREELQRLTGLDAERAARARRREYDEPFLLRDEARLAPLRAAAEARGLRVTRGGRFLHLCGDTDKGRALRALLGLLAAQGRRFATVGLGDSPNDLPLLRAVERPVVVPRPDGRLDVALAAALPRAEAAPFAGPAGWNAAVLTVLGGGVLRRVAA